MLYLASRRLGEEWVLGEGERRWGVDGWRGG